MLIFEAYTNIWPNFVAFFFFFSETIGRNYTQGNVNSSRKVLIVLDNKKISNIFWLILGLKIVMMVFKGIIIHSLEDSI